MEQNLKKSAEDYENLTEDEKFAHRLQMEEYNNLSIMAQGMNMSSMEPMEQNPYNQEQPTLIPRGQRTTFRDL